MRQVGKYLIRRSLGEGTHGQVFHATDTELERDVALKSLKYELKHQKDRIKIIKEARILAKLNHKNIITLYEIYEFKDHLYLSMELINSETLKFISKNRQLSSSQIRSIAIETAEGLAYAHSRNVVHGDLKPDNLLIENNDTVKIVDFGIARATDTQKMIETLADDVNTPSGLTGTLPYMAPELLTGSPADTGTDIFAFGALLYEMLTGKRAFPGRNEATILHNILHEQPAPIPAGILDAADVPSDWADLIREMLSKDRKDRPASMADVLTRLTGKTAPLRRTWMSIWLPAWPPTRPALIIGALAAGAALAASVWGPAITWLETDDGAPVIERFRSGMAHLHDLKSKTAIADAVDTFEGILAVDQTNAAATAGLSLALFRRYKTEETNDTVLRRAIAAARLALSLEPNLAVAQVAAGWAETYDGTPDAAIGHLDKALMLDPGNLLALEGRIRIHQDAGEKDQARLWLERAIERHPDRRLFRDELGILLYQLADYSGAEQAFRKSLDIEPDNIFGYRNLGASLYAQDKPVEAIKAFQDGLTIRPHPSLYNNLATALFFERRYDEAADAYEHALEAGSMMDNYLVWANLADTYRQIPGRTEDAGNAYRRALALLDEQMRNRPGQPDLISRAALYHAKLGNRGKALAHLDTAFTTHTPSPVILFRAAITHELLGRRDDALDMLHRSVRQGYAMTEIRNDPDLSAAIADPRFKPPVPTP